MTLLEEINSCRLQIKAALDYFPHGRGGGGGAKLIIAAATIRVKVVGYYT